MASPAAARRPIFDELVKLDSTTTPSPQDPPKQATETLLERCLSPLGLELAILGPSGAIEEHQTPIETFQPKLVLELNRTSNAWAGVANAKWVADAADAPEREKDVYPVKAGFRQLHSDADMTTLGQWFDKFLDSQSDVAAENGVPKSSHREEGRCQVSLSSQAPTRPRDRPVSVPPHSSTSGVATFHLQQGQRLPLAEEPGWQDRHMASRHSPEVVEVKTLMKEDFPLQFPLFFDQYTVLVQTWMAERRSEYKTVCASRVVGDELLLKNVKKPCAKPQTDNPAIARFTEEQGPGPRVDLTRLVTVATIEDDKKIIGGVVTIFSWSGTAFTSIRVDVNTEGKIAQTLYARQRNFTAEVTGKFVESIAASAQTILAVPDTPAAAATVLAYTMRYALAGGDFEDLKIVTNPAMVEGQMGRFSELAKAELQTMVLNLMADDSVKE
ncbi:hypothetical protein BU16DRAFT_544328 [Lophium mytilinum]|uniref:Uncharacterized protein n=1 Tax=Lophium mytilinum TaxID=390894 RepID=A0A6A6QD92_9PEZI|nr:hypothetical protein BU16DRAFT_544328 [Lophium mytilinum]